MSKAADEKFAALTTKIEAIEKTLTTKIEAIEKALTDLTSMVEKILKYTNKATKDAKKANRKEKREGVSGFAVPIDVSDELREFIQLPKGELISRVDATKKITAYIKEHNLQSKENGRVIVPDAELEKLLDSKGQQVSWFTLQRFMKKHFVTKTNA